VFLIKFCNKKNTGQKGTVGRVVPSYEMPFIESGPNAGTSPDILLNVCSLMRVTQGLLIEILMGKARSMSPTLLSQYNTIFLEEKSFQNRLRIASHILQINGLSYKGKDRMICGQTGLPLKCQIYNGFAYVRVLKQLAKDKLRSRDRGPVNELTRQTSVGKKQFGGQKLGEMEAWNLASHGVPGMLQSIIYESADKFSIFHCTKCNNTAIGCIASEFFYCKYCESSSDLVRLPIAYITTLTFQELYTCGFGHKLIAKKKQITGTSLDETSIFYNNPK